MPTKAKFLHAPASPSILFGSEPALSHFENVRTKKKKARVDPAHV